MAKNINDPAESEKRDAWEDYRKFYPRRMQASLLLAVIAGLLLTVVYLRREKNRSVMEPYMNGEKLQAPGGGK